jgi:predicted nucleic acid-binding protein
MIVVDTSIWIDHFRNANSELVKLLTASAEIVCHPFIIGELALGSMNAQSAALVCLGQLPQLTIARHDEVMTAVQRHKLARTGIGYVDAQLVTAVLLTPGTKIWTKDRELHAVARVLKIAS